MVIRHTSLPHLSIVGYDYETEKYQSVRTHPNAEVIEGVLNISLEESLYFANVDQIKKIFQRIEKLGGAHVHPSNEMDGIPALQAIIINVTRVPKMDGTYVFNTILTAVPPWFYMK